MSKQNAKSGTSFQNEIRDDCEWLESRQLAHIVEIPDPFRVRSYNGARVTGHFESPKEVDFAGTLASGRSIVFEAKATKAATRFSFAKLETSGTEEEQNRQRDLLARHAAMGAVSFVLVRRIVPDRIQQFTYIFPVDAAGVIGNTPDHERRSINWDDAGRFAVPRGRHWWWHLVQLYELPFER
ncbi:MAG: Holliday junction resolvase RecU [Trueperaceae bacterium]|nr:Holliday junction resolvase RecU [Trueperaceae bacterium]